MKNWVCLIQALVPGNSTIKVKYELGSCSNKSKKLIKQIIPRASGIGFLRGGEYMNIREAVLLAMKEGKYIYRKSEKDEGYSVNILPTNTIDCCLMLSNHTNEVGKRWNPNANDLIADDWEVN